MPDEVTAYLDFNPVHQWDQDTWDERTSIIDGRFHRQDVYFTPLVGHGLTMPPGVDRDQWWHVKNEIRPSHVNHNPIGWNQRMTTALYIDQRQKRVRARYRYGSKVQWSKRESLITRFGNDTDAWIRFALQEQLSDNIVGQIERTCRDGLLDNALHRFMYNGDAFELGVADFSTLPDNDTGIFQVDILEDIALRLAYRTEKTRHAWGNYAQPVPGENFRDSVLIMTTSGTYWSIWNSPESDYMVDLAQLQDGRIINGGKVFYRQFATIQDTGAGAQILFNAGNITTQVAVTEPINYGDGAPDPETESVDDMYYAGQHNVKHYVQCSAFTAGDFVKGDVVSIHVRRTDEWGITDGNAFTDGKTYVAEVYEADASSNQLVFRDPITEEFVDPFSYETLAGASASGTAYAFITKATHVHPVFVMGTREGVQFVKRRNIQDGWINYYTPTDNNVDYPSIERVTCDWHGEVNPWELDVYEVFFCNGAFANRGGVEY